MLATARMHEAAEVSANAEAVAAELSRAAGQLRAASRQAMDALAEARLTLLGLAPPVPGGPAAAGVNAGGLTGVARPGMARAVGGPRLRVLIAADRPLLRAGIGRLLSAAGAVAGAGLAGSGFGPRIEIVGEAATADAAVIRLQGTAARRGARGPRLAAAVDGAQGRRRGQGRGRPKAGGAALAGGAAGHRTARRGDGAAARPAA